MNAATRRDLFGGRSCGLAPFWAAAASAADQVPGPAGRLASAAQIRSRATLPGKLKSGSPQSAGNRFGNSA